MTTIDDEVDPFEAGEKTPSPYLDEEVDDFDVLAPDDEEDGNDVDADDSDEDDDDDDESDDDDDSDDDEDDEDDEDDDDLDDDLEDATDAEIDLVVAMYREDGEVVVVPMAKDLANDLDELITQLRRIPGDAGALGMVSISGEFFVLCRVRGRTVQVLLNDSISANDWPLARDVMDYLGEDVPDPDEESEVIGDAALLVDQGVSEFEMESIAEDLDEDADELVRRLAKRMKVQVQFDRAVASHTSH